MNYELEAHECGGGEKRMRRKKKMKVDKLEGLAKNVNGKGGKVVAFLLSLGGLFLKFGRLNLISGLVVKIKFF